MCKRNENHRYQACLPQQAGFLGSVGWSGWHSGVGRFAGLVAVPETEDFHMQKRPDQTKFQRKNIKMKLKSNKWDGG